MKFNFKAKTKTGEIKDGEVAAATKEMAAAVLQKNELFPIFITEAKDASMRKTFLKYFDKVTPKELVIFFRQLAILIEARMPIVTTLTAIGEQTSNLYFKTIILESIKNIEDGMTFSDALGKHRDIFSELSINVIKAGEASGNLKKSVEYVANNIEKNYNLSNKIKSALMYPAVVFIVFLVIGFLVITLIVPKLTIMIKELKAAVPWYTTAIIVVSDFMVAYWWAVILIVLSAAGGLWYYLSTPEGKREWDKVKLDLPIIGVMYRYVYITRFAENLSVLLSGGIPIIKAIQIVSAVVDNCEYEELLLKTADHVKRGGSMSDILRKSALMPSMVAAMVKIGEESGQIEVVLGHIDTFYSQEVDLMAKNMSTLIEPVLMICLGIAVAFMAMGVLMPIYDIAGQIK